MTSSPASSPHGPGEATDPLAHLQALNAGLQREVLDNGMVVLVKPDHSAPVVAIQIWVGTGSIHEGNNLGAGLAHYMEHMIFKGTARRGPADISREIDEAGGSINAYTSHDRTVFYADLPSRSWKTGVDVLADAIMNSSLPEEEWAREKDVILREFAMGYDSPTRVHGKLLYSTAYRVHPYRVPVIGYEEVFRTMTRDHLEAFFREHYVPDNMIFVIVGDVDPAETISFLKDTFAGFERRARPPVILPGEPAQLTPRFARQAGPYQVGRLHWSYHTVGLDHPDAPALDVLAHILGDGRSSILNREIREKRQLVHSIDAWSHTPSMGGIFGISASYDPENESTVISTIRDVLESCRNRPFTAGEIDKAIRNQMVAELADLQTMSGQASSYGAGEYYAGNPCFSEHYLKSLGEVDDARLHQVLETYLLDGFETVAVLSPEEEEESAAPAPDTAASLFPVTRLTLSNGIPLIVREDRRLPFVYVSAALGGGLLTESEGNNGITRLMADLLTRGTETRTAEEIAELLESKGATLSGFAGRNSFGLNAHGLSGDRNLIMEVFADCLINPSFPEEELAKQKRQQAASLRQQQEQPMYLAQQSLRGQLFPGHPYRLDINGTETSIEALSREALQDHFHRQAVPGNLVLSIFGDINAKEAQQLAEAHLGALSGQAASSPDCPDARPELPARADVRGPFEQAILLMGFPGVDMMDPRVDALSVLQRALSGLSSELAIEAREKRGLVYYIGASSMSGPEPGFFTFYAGTSAEQIDEVETLIGEQIHRMIAEGLRDDEIERAKAQLIAAHDMEMQNTGELAQLCALNELYGLGYHHTFTLPERIQPIDAKAIIEAAGTLFPMSRSAVSRLLPE